MSPDSLALPVANSALTGRGTKIMKRILSVAAIALATSSGAADAWINYVREDRMTEEKEIVAVGSHYTEPHEPLQKPYEDIGGVLLRPVCVKILLRSCLGLCLSACRQ